MTRILMTLCAAAFAAAAGLCLGAAPATAYVGEYDFSNRSGGEASARPQRRAVRSPRASRSDVATRRTTRRAPALSSLSGGGLRTSGIASYYWQGQRTANGERYNPAGMTAAHRSLPFGTRVRVTNLNNGRSVTVRINDRGPFIAGRIIDLSRGAAQVVGMTGSGLARVNIAVLGR